MEFNYEGKQPRELILERALKHKPIAIDSKSPLLLKANNFDGLSTLLVSGFRNKIDLVYIDPPFNTKQDFTVGEGRVSTISRGSKAHVAYSDHMTMQEYIEFMRERLIIIHELLSDKGSIYIHIDVKMGHYLKIILDEVFGYKNFKNDISRIKSNPKNFNRKAYGNQRDMVLFYSKDFSQNIFNNIKTELSAAEKERMFKKLAADGRRYNTVPVHAPGETRGATGGLWRDMMPPEGRHWRTDPSKLDLLDEQGLIEWSKNGVPRIKKFADEHTGKKIQDVWSNYIDPAYPLYPTEKNLNMLEMIVAQSSIKDSIVLDCFAGSGSTLLAASNLNRQWIGIDQSEFSIKVIRKRFEHIPYEFIEVLPFDDVSKQ